MNYTAVMSKIAKALFDDPLFTVTMFTATGDGTGEPRIRATMGQNGVAKLTIYHDSGDATDKPYVFMVEMSDLGARQHARDSEAVFPLGVIRSVLNEIGCKASGVLLQSSTVIDSIDASIDAIRASGSPR